jgi:uncharacterized glyoxalase superfamily protein PhnB
MADEPASRERVTPMLHVPDVRRAVDWYRDVGFRVDATYADDEEGGEALTFAVLSWGATQVFLDEGGRASEAPRREVDLYVHTADVDALFGRLRDRVDVVEAPHDTFYGAHEVIIRDLNGFWITFGEPARRG